MKSVLIMAAIAFGLAGCSSDDGGSDVGHDTTADVGADTGAPEDTGEAGDTSTDRDSSAGDAATDTVGDTGSGEICGCNGKNCGDDGCGVSCGECGLGSECNPSGICEVSSCTPGSTECAGFYLMQCDSGGLWQLAELCDLGCEGGATPACSTSCVAGAELGCVNGSGRRCATGGGSAFAVACVAGCSGVTDGCAEVGPQERDLIVAGGDNINARVAAAGFGGDGDILLAWQAQGDVLVKVLLLDAQGNSLGAPVALPATTTTTFTQLQVRAAPGGDFLVMGLEPGGGGQALTTLWRLPRTPGGVPNLVGGLVLDGGLYTGPTPVAWDIGHSLFSLAPGDTAGENIVVRTTWNDQGQALDSIIDDLSLARWDLMAARVSAAAVQVFASGEGTLRVTSVGAAGAATGTTIHDAGDTLFAGVDGAADTGLVAGYDFGQDPEGTVLATYSGGALSAWVDLGASVWFQSCMTDAAPAAVTSVQSGGGEVLELTTGVGTAEQETVTIWPQGDVGEATRDNFWLGHQVGVGIRVITLGADASELPRLRISVHE